MGDREPAVIDLGVIDFAEPAPRESRRAGSWRRHRAAVRGLAAAAAVAAILGGVTTTVPLRRAIEPVLTIPLGDVGGFATDDRAVYAPVAGVDGLRLVSHRLSDGALRWSTPVAAPGRAPGAGNAHVGRYGDVVVASVFTDITPSGNPVSWSMAYDAGTGAALWSREGMVVGVVTSGDLLIGGALATDPNGFPDLRLAAVDPRTGEPAWSMLLPFAEFRSYEFEWLDRVDGRAGRMVTLDVYGRLRVADLTTGAVVAERVLEPSDVETHMALAGGVVLVSTRSGADAVRAYDVGTLAPRWSAPGSVEEWAAASTCGPWICLPHDDGLRAIEPASGAVAWSRAGVVTAYEPGAPWPTGLMIAIAADRDGRELIDARTGRTVDQLGAWTPIGRAGDTSLLVATAPDEVGTPEVWIGRYRPDEAGVDVLGPLPDVQHCGGAGDRLVCYTNGNEVRIWRLRA